MVNDLATLFEVMVAFLFVTFIQAFLLRACCTLYNLLADAPNKPSGPTVEGEPETDVIGHPEANVEDWATYEKSLTLPGVPRPSLERAMRIIFFASLVNTTGSYIIFRLARLVGWVSARGTVRSLWILLCFVPLGILVLGGLTAAMLPTTSTKGMLVSLLFHLLNFLIAAILIAVIFLIQLAFSVNLDLTG